MFMYDQLFTYSDFIYSQSGLRHPTKPKVLLARPNHIIRQLFLKSTTKISDSPVFAGPSNAFSDFNLSSYPVLREVVQGIQFSALRCLQSGWESAFHSSGDKGLNGWTPKQPAVNICSQIYFIQVSININQPSLASWGGHMSTTLTFSKCPNQSAEAAHIAPPVWDATSPVMAQISPGQWTSGERASLPGATGLAREMTWTLYTTNQNLTLILWFTCFCWIACVLTEL